MKHGLLLATLCAFAAPFLLASPSPTRAIPEADFLLLCDRMDAELPNQARWERFQKRYENLYGTDQAAFLADFHPIFKAAFGMTPEGRVEDVESVAVSITLPKTLTAFESLDQDQWPDDLGLYSFVENPKADLTGVNTAFAQLLAENPDSGAKLTQNGRWTALSPTDPAEAAGMPLIAWSPIARGFAFVLCKDYAAADRAANNSVVPAPGSLLAKAFKAPSAQGPWGRFVIRDLSELLDRYVTDPAERQEVMATMPFIFQTHGLIASLFYRADGTLQLEVKAITNSAAEALQARDMLITIKVMIRQGVVPQFYGTHYADLFSGIIDSARCKAEGNAATLTLSLTPDQAEALLDFIAVIQSAPTEEEAELPFDDYE